MTEETQEHTEGPSWSTAGRFKTFEEADLKRRELAADEDLHAKVQWMRKRNDFVVKTRLDPLAVAEEERQQHREEKKRRKTKLNKKRRKK
jgi:hypothetical protein